MLVTNTMFGAAEMLRLGAFGRRPSGGHGRNPDGRSVSDRAMISVDIREASFT
jgi:hypothetical protein